MSITSDTATNKISAIIREIEENKDKEIESARSQTTIAIKELADYKPRVEEAYRKLLEESQKELANVSSELERVRGLFADLRKQFTAAVERYTSELKDRDQHVARLLRVTDELQGEIDVLKDGYATLKANSARASVAVSEQKEAMRKEFEDSLDNLKGENLALSAKLRGKKPKDEVAKALAKEAAEALRERTYQTWDRKKYLGLLNRLDEAAGG